MKVGFKVQGGEQLANNLRQLPTRVAKTVLRDALKAAAEPMRAQAQQVVQHGEVIDIANSRDSEPMSFTIALGPQKFYGFLQEFGTRFIPAHSFLRPAFDGQVQGTITRLTGLLWRALVVRGFSTRGSGGGGGLE